MTLFLSIMGHLAAMIAAGIAIVGTTWDASAIGWRKLTITGRTAAAVALAGFIVSSASSVQSYLDEQERQAAAVAEIDAVWRTLVHPFGLMLWAIDGKQSNPDLSLVGRLLKAGMLEKLNGLDLRGEAPHHHGSWATNICGATKRGFEQLRQMQTIYVGVISPVLITRMKDVATSYAVQAMQTLAPCSGFKPDDAYPWQLHAITNLDEFRRYLGALHALRVALDEA